LSESADAVVWKANKAESTRLLLKKNRFIVFLNRFKS
jgi:hypothetical protein